MKLIYLACPYSHQHKNVRHLRHFLVTLVGDKLIQKGHHIFSPITESHMYQLHGDCGGSWDFWASHDKLMLRKCDELWVLMLEGWDKSVGVKAEIEYAKTKQMKIKYLNLYDIVPELLEVV